VLSLSDRYEQEMKDPGEFECAAPRASISAQEMKMAKLLTEAMGVDGRQKLAIP
jgi:hypothetical protein